MTKTELLEIIRNGESSGVEFKRDDVHPDKLAMEIAALLNLEGGVILLGVEDDGNIAGLTRERQEAEQWVFNICRHNLQPSLIPYWETIHWDEATTVGIIRLIEDSPDKPYKAKRGSSWVTFVRVGSTSREATREEEARLYQASQLLRYDIKAVPGTSITNLDRRRLENYLLNIMKETDSVVSREEEWERVLVNLEILIPTKPGNVATVGGLLLFGENPNRYLPQAGITATAYPDKEKDYATVDEEIIRGPLVSLLSAKGEIVESGVIDRTVQFVARNMGTTAWLEDGRRRRKGSFPLPAVREAIVNAVAHRDYTITVTDIEISLYSDRLEIISPGRLPNTVTVEKMKQGYRAARNELLKEILRDYGYIEHRGMGVRRKIIQGMLEHNGTEPGLVEEEARFVVCLWKDR